MDKTGMAIPHIYFKDYGTAKIYCPSYAEQKHIADVLGKLENKLFLEQNILASLNLQKRQMFSLSEISYPVSASSMTRLRIYLSRAKTFTAISAIYGRCGFNNDGIFTGAKLSMIYATFPTSVPTGTPEA